MRWWVGVVWWLAVVGAAAAQPAVPARLPAVPDVPPFVLPVLENSSLTNGTTVSRPLEAVAPSSLEANPPPATATEPPAAESQEPLGPLGKSWGVYEYFLWWPKHQPLPPLATASAPGTVPALGAPGTSLLLGSGSLNTPSLSGGRFTLGDSLNAEQTVGVEITYLFSGDGTASATALSAGPPQVIGRPVLNPRTGLEDAVPVSSPGQLLGTFDAAATTRITGWEITGVSNLIAQPGLRINALAGYRYFMANEGLRLDQFGWQMPGTNGFPNGAMVGAADQFDAHNRFHGGQLGLHTDYENGSVFVELTGKVGLGQVNEVVRVSGQTVVTTPGSPFPVVQSYPGGVLAQPSNSGRFVHSAFAVLPEGTVKIGYRFRDRSRLYMGYNFLYLSEAVRAGDQIDRTVDPATIPMLSPTGTLTARPSPVMARSDFWVQGLIFGLECRY